MPPHPMAGAPELSPRQRLDLRIVSDDGVHALRTQLEHLEGTTGRLVVIWPTEQLRLFPLRPGQAIVVELSRPGDALYTRETLIESATTEEPPRLVLRPVSDWQRVERREAVRHPLDIRPSLAHRILRGGERQPISAVIADLSTGGMRMATSTEVEIDDQVELAFGTPSGGAELRLRVTVVRVAPARSVGHDTWEIGCQFVEPRKVEREQIVQFILAQLQAVERADRASF
jgi:c-di-GMP-binding flagellar brake protein YcgR